MISPYKLWIQAKGDSAEYKRLLFKHGCIRIKENKMHYRNGREAKNGDKVVLFPSYGVPVIGILYDATAGNDFCNGKIAITAPNDVCPNLKEVLHLDDVMDNLKKDILGVTT